MSWTVFFRIFESHFQIRYMAKTASYTNIRLFVTSLVGVMVRFRAGFKVRVGVRAIQLELVLGLELVLMLGFTCLCCSIPF